MERGHSPLPFFYPPYILYGVLCTGPKVVLVYFAHTKIKTLPIGYWFNQWELVLFIWLRRVVRENSATISLEWYNQVRILAGERILKNKET